MKQVHVFLFYQLERVNAVFLCNDQRGSGVVSMCHLLCQVHWDLNDGIWKESEPYLICESTDEKTMSSPELTVHGPSLRVHLMSPDCLETACRLPSSVDTNRRDSGRVTDLAAAT